MVVFTTGRPFDDEGHAEIRGAPEGTWDLMLRRIITFKQGSNARLHLIRQGLQIRNGHSEEIAWDLSRFEPGTLKVSVFVDEKPATGMLSLRREFESVTPNGEQQSNQRYLQVTAESRVQVKLEPGLWHGSMNVQTETKQWLSLPLSPAFTIVAGQDSDLRLQTFMATQTVRILDHAGKPAAGVVLYLRLKDTSAVQLRPSSDSGEAEIRGAQGTYGVRVRIRSLSSSIAFGTWRNKQLAASGNDWKVVNTAVEARTLDLSDITLEPGGNTETLVIRLPEDWDR